jgi:signal transduction histidine kinase
MLQGRPCDLWLVRGVAPRARRELAVRRDKEQRVFLGEVVHELRSPLAVIRQSVDILRKGARGTADRATFLGFIENHAVRMASLVDQLLDLSAADFVKRGARRAAVPLAEVMGEIAAPFVPVAKRRGITITIDIPRRLAVRADSAVLPHAFGNLLDNALKFTPRGGAVEIRGRAEGGEGIVTVRDTGPGIAPEDLTRIFERFYRGERARSMKGTGLGLAIVSGIVKANRGRVFAENHPAGGAVFHVALPLNMRDSPHP